MTKNATKIIRSCLAGLFMGKKGNSHLKSITCSVLLTFLTSSPSWGGTSPIHHPRGSFSEPQSEHKCHQDNKILLSRPFHRERGQQLPGVYHLLSLPDLSYLILLLGWYIIHPIPQGPLSEPQSDQKCHQDNQILLSRTFFGGKRGKSSEIYHLFSTPDFYYLFPLLG